MTGEIPSELGRLTTLRTLQLAHNSFSGTVPFVFSRLKKLENLSLVGNGLEGALPEALCGSGKLPIEAVGCNLTCDCCLNVEKICGDSNTGI
mmetsp:Transcript_22948/g.53187  ORF Transcript_22948/g.53187 Transcript_22948/m.53187 type:complete len:92 (+) Transcript_22948:947-1222(+)